MMLRMVIKSSELVPVGAVTSPANITVEKDGEYTIDTVMDLSNLAPGKYIGSFTLFTYKDTITEEYDSISDVFFFEIEPSQGDLPWHSRWVGHTQFPDMHIKQI